MCYLENENIDVKLMQTRNLKPSRIIGYCKKYNCKLKFRQANNSCFRNFKFCTYFEPNLLHNYWIGRKYKIPKEEDLIIFDDIISIYCDASFYEPDIAIVAFVVIYKDDIIDKKHTVTKAKGCYQAEIYSIQEALKYIRKHKIIKKVYLYSDCLGAIVNKNKYFKSYMLDNICFKWIPRKLNKLADKYTQCII